MTQRCRFPQHLILCKLSFLTSSSPIQAMPFSPKGSIAVFIAQENHFPKRKHTTFLESRKGGSIFSINRPFCISPTRFHTSLPSARGVSWGQKPTLFILYHQPHRCSHAHHTKSPRLPSILRTEPPTYSHLFLPQCLAQDGSRRGRPVNVCLIELVWWGKCVATDREEGTDLEQEGSYCILITAHIYWAFY